MTTPMEKLERQLVVDLEGARKTIKQWARKLEQSEDPARTLMWASEAFAAAARVTVLEWLIPSVRAHAERGDTLCEFRDHIANITLVGVRNSGRSSGRCSDMLTNEENKFLAGLLTDFGSPLTWGKLHDD